MATARTSARSSKVRRAVPAPPQQQEETVIHGDRATIQRWLTHYGSKLEIPEHELRLLAITQDRQEFMLWTGKRLNFMTLGCYCYIPPTGHPQNEQNQQHLHRHLIFIEPDMQAKSLEVTIAHELIHMMDRVKGTPRRHRHHGYDSIAVDEAAVTGYSLEELRALLHEESNRREQKHRQLRPIRYVYECPNCGRTYPRMRKYTQAVSCSSCDKSYNPSFRLFMSRG